MTAIELAYERNFDTLLQNSIELMLEAMALHPIHDKNHTLARASIIFSLLILEATANTCIEHLDLETSIHKEIDHLPVLGKFDFYLRTKFRNKRLERGEKQIEWVKELKNIRDGLVHLKPHKVEWETSQDGAHASASAVRTKALNISTNPKFWDSEEAAKVARAVHGFLYYFFKNKCKYSASKVSSLLFSESKVPGDENHFLVCMDRGIKNKLLAQGIDLSYVKIAWV